MDRIAIKRLTASDCTLFEAVFRKIGAGNQKSINLNADVLTGQLYPNLAQTAILTENEVPLPLSIYGPGGKGVHKLTRKIIKNPTYKNWRLNGEFISGPPGDTERYDNISPGDLAIMAFKGDIVPTQMEILLVSQSSQIDSNLHTNLLALFGNRSMIAVSAAQITSAINSSAVLASHPVNLIVNDPEMQAALEDAAQGGILGTGRLLKNKTWRKVTNTDLMKAKAKAEQIGQDGEGLVNAYLALKLSNSAISSYKWVSSENAVSPYDFEIETAPNQHCFVDVKTTNGPFENIIHLSIAEIIEAAGDAEYRLYRIFEINESGGKLRISEKINDLARTLKSIHETHMPIGARIDSFSITPELMKWGPEEYVERPEE